MTSHAAVDRVIAPEPKVETFEPTWEIAHLFPAQGTWSEEEYLAWNTNRLMEFSHGYVEVLPMPTQSHQLIVLGLYRALQAFVEAHRLGMVLVAPLRVRLWPGKYREPDVVFMLAEHDSRRHEQFWETPDLVMEVVSEENRYLDLEVKRREYAQAGIPEYWVVDPAQARITILRLEGTQYALHGEFECGTQATSALLEGFAVDVMAVLTP